MGKVLMLYEVGAGTQWKDVNLNAKTMQQLYHVRPSWAVIYMKPETATYTKRASKWTQSSHYLPQLHVFKYDIKSSMGKGLADSTATFTPLK
jgi:hypothetical protein